MAEHILLSGGAKIIPVAMQIGQTRIGINHAIRRIGIESEFLEDCYKLTLQIAKFG